MRNQSNYETAPRLNVTPDVVILTDNLCADLRSALDTLSGRTEAKVTQLRPDSRKSAQYRRAFALYAQPNFNTECDPVDLVNAFCDFSVAPVNQQANETLARLYRGTLSKKRLSGVGLQLLRQHAKYILYTLWCRGKLLLPITFAVNNSIQRSEQLEISPELMRFCLGFPTNGAAGSTAYRMQQQVPRWLTCTGWLTPEDISMQEGLEINRFLLSCSNGDAGFSAPSLAPSTRMFLAECLKNFPDRLGFNGEDLQKFDSYFARHLGADVRFDEIGSKLKEADAAKAARRAATERVSRTERAKTARSGAAENVSRIEQLNRDAEKSDAERLVYAVKYPRNGWFPDVQSLSFLRRVMSSEARLHWSNLFDKYISYRLNTKGYESEEAAGSLRVLADYLCVCLPVFYHETSVDGVLPSRPREFKRFPFIDDRGEGENGAPTFLEYVAKRYSSQDSRYTHINHARLFLEHIERNYGDPESQDIAGPSFRNPISQEFDLPKVKGAKARRTNKKPFAKFVVPHLISWFYAVETFGMYLQNTCQDIPGRGTTLQTEQYGFVPVYFHLGTLHYLTEIPASFVRPQQNFHRPSLTILRMLIVALETGLRLQGVQWLCRKKFDRLNIGAGQRDYFLLIVNTDKSNDGFTTPILPRVRELLLRETADQEAYRVEDREIYYENRIHSRFDKLVPLFRNVNTHQPYTDSAYDRFWCVALEAFDKFFSDIGDVQFVQLVRPKSTTLQWTSEGDQFCPLKVQPLYTPHSCRSTFITRRSPFIELDDVARLVGQKDRIVASHYDYPEFDELGAKLTFADRAVGSESDPGPRVRSGPAFIKAKDQNSALVSSFREDRDRTIQAFGMIALRRTLEAAEDDDSGGLELLRASPMSQVAFRETHICPVGEHCPEEVVAETGGQRRCGICPLACKCIEHLPAITAKQRQLLERIQSSREAYNRLLQLKTEASEIGEVYDAIEADFQEYLGWRLAEEILEDMRLRLGPASEHLHAAQPEIIRQHLTRVVKTSDQQEFVLRRIVEANEYPTLATDRLRLQALKLKRRLMAGQFELELLDAHDDEEDEIAGFARLVSTVLRSRKMTLEHLADSINRPLPAQRERRLLLAHQGG